MKNTVKTNVEGFIGTLIPTTATNASNRASNERLLLICSVRFSF